LYRINVDDTLRVQEPKEAAAMMEMIVVVGIWLLCIAVIVFEKWLCEPNSLQWRWQVTKPSERFLLLATVVFRGASLAGIGVIFVCAAVSFWTGGVVGLERRRAPGALLCACGPCAS